MIAVRMRNETVPARRFAIQIQLMFVNLQIVSPFKHELDLSFTEAVFPMIARKLRRSFPRVSRTWFMIYAPRRSRVKHFVFISMPAKCCTGKPEDYAEH